MLKPNFENSKYKNAEKKKKIFVVRKIERYKELLRTTKIHNKLFQ